VLLDAIRSYDTNETKKKLINFYFTLGVKNVMSAFPNKGKKPTGAT
jgi:hypothetical protein